ncbi:phage holin family protein [Akkermansiaceae bacterium]|nr:phage holin family protein [Akkermansiaceae bacterium]
MQPTDEEISVDDLTLKQSVAYFKHSAKDYFATKAELLLIEVQEAAEFAKGKIIAVVLLGLFALVTYLLLWVFFIGLGAVLLNGKLGVISELGAEWLVFLFASIVFHVIAILVVLLKLKKKPDGELFEITKLELNRDKQWLGKGN